MIHKIYDDTSINEKIRKNRNIKKGLTNVKNQSQDLDTVTLLPVQGIKKERFIVTMFSEDNLKK